MPIPDVAQVQFAPAGGKFYLDSIVDPSGVPSTVLDIDIGFTVKGRVELPGWLSGKGLVRLFADEIGGQIDKEIGRATPNITGSSSPTDPPTVVYPWQITVASPTLPDPSPGSSLYQLGLSFVLQSAAGGHTDIGAFFDLGAYLIV